MFNKAVVSLLPYVPRPLVWRVSRRYIAGESIDDALALVADLNGAGMRATLDVLGEDTLERGPAEESRDRYLEALERIAERGLDCNISVKLSQMGLRFDARLCSEIAHTLADAAAANGNFLRIDMEDSSVTTATLDIYRAVRRRTPSVGTVVQSRLKRTAADIDELLAGGVTNLRLCKGIYVEPPEVAYQSASGVRDSFEAALQRMLEARAFVGIATHDEELIEDALGRIQRLQVPPERYEFQMLLGVTERLRDRLVAAGHPLRVYVPFGRDWFAYSIRRLRENPQIASHVIRGFLGGS